MFANVMTYIKWMSIFYYSWPIIHNVKNATDIVQRCKLTKSHVSTSLKFLEEQGYIEKYYQEGNHKTIYLHMLAKADKVLPMVEKHRNGFKSVC